MYYFKEQLIEPNLDLDELLPVVGEFGPYQKLMLWLVCLPAYIPCGFCAFNELFMADVPPHWCDTAELRLLTNFSNERRRVLTIPPSQVSIKFVKKCNLLNVISGVPGGGGVRTGRHF